MITLVQRYLTEAEAGLEPRSRQPHRSPTRTPVDVEGEIVENAAVADALADYQIRWPTIPVVFCETQSLAEEWTYRYLAAAWQWATTEPAAQARTLATRGRVGAVLLRMAIFDVPTLASGPPAPKPAKEWHVPMAPSGRGDQAISQKLSLGEKFWEIGSGGGTRMRLPAT